MSQGLRVALIYLGRRGMGNPLSFTMAQTLHKQGVPLLAVTSSFSEAASLWAKAPFSTLALPTYRHLSEMLLTTLQGQALRRIAEGVVAFQPDVLLFPMFHPWNLWLQRRFAHLPSVTVVHDPHPHPMFYDRLAARLEHLSLRRATRCVTLSNAMAQALAQRGIPAERIEIAPLERLLAFPEARLPGPSFAPPTVLFFGRITRYKGVAYLLDAMERLWQRLPEAHLHLIGSGDLNPYSAWLQRYQDDPRVQVRQTWVPEEEIPSVFRGASVVVLPYTSATQSGVAVLAASFGLPVVATTMGALPEQVEDGVSGWLVPPADAAALTAALFQALTQPEETQRRGHALWKRLASPAAQAEAVQAILQALQRAMAAPG
ncbi:MAG TPA: glycosyltransferase family 4 protein [Anaerolineae bacterium]|nr:glycosyltransferase family 4 protein [Anaerolineae bacterium]